MLPGFVFILFLIPVITSSLLDLQQRRANELIAEQLLAQEQAQKDAAEKIYLLGKFDPSQDSDFAPVPDEYDIGGYQMYLRKETLAAFEDMAEKADEDGVELKIASATRNFDYQKKLWDDKWEGVTLVDGQNLAKTMPDGIERFGTILEYSAAPGTSRHHWGTEIDINDANVPYFNTADGEKVYDWMTQNAMNFGFCQTYTLKGEGERENGYSEEKWHWSYLPLSRGFTQDYKRLITDADISGFDGDQYGSYFNLIPNYVLSINPACR